MRTFALLLVVFLACTAPAYAEQVAVVVDRGRGAAEEGARLAATAARLVTSLRSRGHDVKLYVYGTRPSGGIRAAELRGAPDKALETAAERAGWRFEGPTDPRHALHTVVRRNRTEEALLVVLVGPFGHAGGEIDEEAAQEALATWNVRAPVGSRAFALSLGEGVEARVAEAEGWVGSGVFVLLAEEPAVSAAPYSPLSEDPLHARVRIPLGVLTIGQGTHAPLLIAESSRAGDRLAFPAPLERAGGLDAIVELERSERDRRTATLAFAAPEDPAVVWFTDVPTPRTFQWQDLLPDARMTSTNAPTILPFVIRDGEVGRPYTATFRIVRTRTEPAPDFSVAGKLPRGLEASVGPEGSMDEATAFREVKLSFTPEAGRPVSWEGSVAIVADHGEHRFEVPVSIEVPPGRVVLRLEAPAEPQALPLAKDDPAWTIEVEAANANAPATVEVHARVDPPEATPLLIATVVTPDGLEATWDLERPTRVVVGRATPLRMALAPHVRGAEATVELTLVTREGLEGSVEGIGRVTRRKPRLVLADGEWAYRVEDGEVVGDPPLALELDPDGGSGPWLVDITTAPPTAETDAGAPVTFTLKRQTWNRWILEPAGAWEGARGNAISARTETIQVRLAWPEGGTPEALAVEVLVPPRWGSAGWILIGLAALAVLLAGWGALQLRPTPLEGTLLYTVAGREGAVGRLDLKAAGRRARAIRADRGGRLALGGKGDAIAMVRPTRVGGLLVTASDGERQEHLLVDGVTLTVGRHRMRYASGRPDDAVLPPVPQDESALLGPEFEIESGRIQALDDTGEAAEPDTRS